jgi:hypothetical protein
MPTPAQRIHRKSGNAAAPQSQLLAVRFGFVLGARRIFVCVFALTLAIAPGAARPLRITPVLFAAAPATSVSPLPPAGQTEVVKDDCKGYLHNVVPKYRVARKAKPDEKTGLELSISISLTDFSRVKLVALVCSLGREHADEQALYVWILDDYRAAKDFTAGPIANGENNNLSLRAIYRFSREKGNEIHTVTWWPDPTDRDRSVQIDLGQPPQR